MIYLDNNATTQPLPCVVEAMLPYLRDCYFNPSAAATAFTEADRPRREAAAALTHLLKAEGPECFVFTSGATESNNWVLHSVSRTHSGGHVAISAIEHASVLEPAEALRNMGFDVTLVPVDGQGRLVLSDLTACLRADTVLISVMAANNETGVLQNIGAVGEIARRRAPKALFHTDATQAVGKLDIDLQGAWPEVDLLAFSGHKFHGPKGIGGLYIRPGILISPLLHGGGQEGGLRAGTLNTPCLAGLAAAAKEAANCSMGEARVLRDLFEQSLLDAFPGAVIHSAEGPRLCNTSCFSMPGQVGQDLADRLAVEGIIIGTGAACSADALHPPKTLLAMGVDYSLAGSALRVSLSRLSRPDDVRELTAALRRFHADRPRSPDNNAADAVNRVGV